MRAVQETHLSAAAFFVGDLSAGFEAAQYEEFRAFMETTLRAAAVEFAQLDVALRDIADEYDRTESVHEIDLARFYSVQGDTP